MATWWNNAKKGTGVGLSGSGYNAADFLTVSYSSSGGIATSLELVNFGKWYFEYKVDAVSGNNLEGGIVFSDVDVESWVGLDANTFGLEITGGIYQSNTQLVAAWVTIVANDIVSVAIDLDRNLVWWRVNGGNWNGNASYNPVTGLGGVSIASRGPLGVYAAISPDLTGNTATARFSRMSWAYTPPWGFEELGYVQAAPVTSWNTNGTTSTVTLSNGNRTAKGNTGYTVGLGKSTLPVSGKVYFEARIDAFSLSDAWIIGIVQATAATNDGFGGGTRRVGVLVNSSGNVVVYNDGSVAATLGTAVAGQIVSIAYDADNNRFWGRLDNGNWNASGSADPAGGTGSVSTSLLTGQRVVGFTTFTTSDQLTVAFHPSQWTKWAPVGFGPIA